MELLEREGLLEALGQRFAETRRGAGHVIVLSGEAGGGKSALVNAFCSGLPDGCTVLWGACDPVAPPRPFAPLLDMAYKRSAELHSALSSSNRNLVFDAFLALLHAPSPYPKVVVFEDLHWADEPTLDVLRVVGRRVERLPALLLLTFRSDDVASAANVSGALGDIAAGAVTTVTVPPLTLDAVKVLVRDSAHDPQRLHAATGGNPFFVTEVLAGDSDVVPLTVRDAVLARTRRLSHTAQACLRAASLLGESFREEVLLAVSANNTEALAECISAGLLVRRSATLQFRHDIARRVVETSLAPAERRRIHARALKVMERWPAADPAVLVVHAVGAGEQRSAAEFACAAGDQASALGAHGDAVAHYGVALRAGGHFHDRRRGGLLESLALACAKTNRADRAVSLQEEALLLWRRLGDLCRVGAALRALSDYAWLVGDGVRALELAESAVTMLAGPDARPGADLAHAYATLAQRVMVDGAPDPTVLGLARRALDLAERCGDESVAVHALTTIGVIEAYQADGGWTTLEEAARRGRVLGLGDASARALLNLIQAARDLRRYDIADSYTDAAIAATTTHDLQTLRNVMRADLAAIALERGRWDAAEALAVEVLRLPRTSNRARVWALTVMGRLRARRGDDDPFGPLDEAMDHWGAAAADEDGVMALRAARAEAAWLTGDITRAGNEAQAGLGSPVVALQPWWAGDLHLWAWKAGISDRAPGDIAEPYSLHIARRVREAADLWSMVGCPYQEAMALADSQDDADLLAALEICHALGAKPLGRLIAAQLRARGRTGVPRGPRETSRRNPAGMTTREVQVLGLMVDGLTNREIAASLVLSVRTVDHHVSAILRKLKVRDRAAAIARVQGAEIQHGWSVAST